ncbi:MAG: hypothetical protein L7F77_13335 [Candidatus Magnetominusculus sp. LBB02]|nr:hypothetical protein [Candidatus Magnetominusculus sp. LBB02]
MKPYKAKFLASMFVLIAAVSYMIFDHIPYFDYSEQKADITPIMAAGRASYDIGDFNPVIDNISPSSQEDCKLSTCGHAFNWSLRRYSDADGDNKITVRITRFQSADNAAIYFNDYIAAVRTNRFDRTISGDDYHKVFISGVKKLRWEVPPPTPNGLYASRVLFLKNNVIVDIEETSKSNGGEYKNSLVAGLGRQLTAVPKAGGK